MTTTEFPGAGDWADTPLEVTIHPPGGEGWRTDLVQLTVAGRGDEDSASTFLDAEAVWALERLLVEWRMARVYHAEATGGFKVWYRSGSTLSVDIEESREAAFAEAYLLTETCDDSWNYSLVAIEGPDGSMIDLGEYRRYVEAEERDRRESRIELDRRRREGVTEEWKIEVRTPESVRKSDREEWVQWYGTYSDEAGAREKSLQAVTAFGADRVRVTGGPVNAGGLR